MELGCYFSVTPWHEFVETCDFVVGDLCEDPIEPCLGIDDIKFGGFDQRIGDCRGVAATF